MIWTLIIAFIVFFFGKFIWDTYLTDNTDRNWEKFRQDNPADAARIVYQNNRKIYSLDTKEKKEILDGIMKKKFPNFYKFCYDRRLPLKMEFCKDDNVTLEFKMPILTYGKIMGFNHLGIEDKLNGFYIYMDSISRGGHKIIGKRIKIFNDQTEEEYDENTNELITYLMTETEYIQISIGNIL